MSLPGALFLTIVNIFGLYLGFSFLNHYHYIPGTLVLIILIMTDFIFIPKKAYPYRFMYPGLVTFLLFMIFPIVFTIYIGFTNLSTGHFLSFDDAKQTLLSEFIIEEDASPINYKLYLAPENNRYFIVVDDVYEGKFSVDNSNDEISLAPRENFDLNSALEAPAVLLLKNKLKHKKFLLNDKTYRFYRADQLIEKTPKFREQGDSLVELKTGKLFIPNKTEGNFFHDKEKLAPGFFVNVGFKNFLSLINDERLNGPFFKVLLWTLCWAFFSVMSTFIMGMFLALLLNDKNLRLKPLYRTLLVVPYSIPFFISVLIFKGMMNQDFGILNDLIASLGFAKIPWLSDPTWAKISALTVNLWLGFPYMFLVITGILQSIPRSVYEAAALDGAKRWRTFRSITMPLIMSAIGPLLVGSFAFNLNNFVGIYLLTGGLPPMQGVSTPVGETDILISYTYRLAFEGGRGQDFGLASSIAIFIFIIITLLTLANFKLSGMMKEESK